MRGWSTRGWAALGFMMVLLPAAAPAQDGTVPLPNPSFESGKDNPDGWSLSEGQGRWLEGRPGDGATADGRRAVAVTGDGQNSNFWRSGPIAFAPSTVYCVRFSARSMGTTGGTPVTGPSFCNRDLGGVGEKWERYESIFASPAELAPDSAWLRFGQWCVKGEIAFDQVELVQAQPTYRQQDGVVLGEGEAVSGNQYTFDAPYSGISRNQSRPLASYRCTFNTDRWAFGLGSELVYRHEVSGRHQTTGEVTVTVGYYTSGQLAVEAAKDGVNWKPAGIVDGLKSARFPIPKELLPADRIPPAATIWVRLRAQDKERAGGGPEPAAFQVTAYGYTATLDGAPINVRGETRFLIVEEAEARLAVAIESLGDALPGGQNVVTARVVNRGGEPIAARPTMTVQVNGRDPVVSAMDATLKPGEQVVRLPYEMAGTGVNELELTLGPNVRYRAKTQARVCELFDASYGERLPSPKDDVALWWASSGWKVSEGRPAPQAHGEALALRAARNEAEAAQLVVRPAKDLRGLTARGTALTGPGGASVPAENVEVLRVRYLDVTRPTDGSSVAAPWPDPLPPFKGPINVAARKNQPLWVRVTVPRGVPAGTYAGAVRIEADGFAADVPLRLEVYDFDLPDRMTCTTAFGFDPGSAFAYQKVSDPQQQRQVLDKYLRDYGAHHVTPYDPAPLDPFKVEWTGLGPWTGGRRVQAEKHAGESSLMLADSSANENVGAAYDKKVAIPAQGLRLRFWYKTRTAGQASLVTLAHVDGNGQWMSGRNNDMGFEGNGEWQLFDKTMAQFPDGAKSVTLTLWAAPWREVGSTTGAIWYDDVSLHDAGSGAELAAGGDFEHAAPASPQAAPDPKPVFDWAAWDAAMARAMDDYHFNSFSIGIPGLGGGTFHSRVEPSLAGYAEDTPEYKAAFHAYCSEVEAHLREKGWLDKAYVYWFDEPDPKDYPFVMNGFRKLEENCPGIGRMLTEQVEPQLVGGPNIWCPVTPAYNNEPAEERRKAGDRFWWYVCCGPKEPYCGLFIDHPATELRVWLWQTWQRKIQGILIWHTNYWTSPAAYPDTRQNPYDDPMSWVSGYDTPAGTRSPWGNGDGRFVYPPEAAGGGNQADALLDGPVDSIRWEMLRDGIEDYEYLCILRGLLQAKPEKLNADERARFESLLEVPATITSDMTTFTKDPAPIEQRRHEIAKAIEALKAR